MLYLNVPPAPRGGGGGEGGVTNSLCFDAYADGYNPIGFNDDPFIRINGWSSLKGSSYD